MARYKQVHPKLVQVEYKFYVARDTTKKKKRVEEKKEGENSPLTVKREEGGAFYGCINLGGPRT
jgi:hypothetical protein